MSINPFTSGRFVDFGILKSDSTTTGVRLTANMDDPDAAILVQAVSFQAISSGTGVVYICNTPTPTLGDGVQAGVLWEVPPPSATPVTRPLLAIGNPTGPQPINAGELYVVPTVSGEGVRGTGMQ